ncbi:MAG: hypothetical protein V4654_09115 [Bdellovibrionota bacterium]
MTEQVEDTLRSLNPSEVYICDAKIGGSYGPNHRYYELNCKN